MLDIKYIVCILTSHLFLGQTIGLAVYPSPSDKDILETEKIIRTVFNKLFNNLQLNRVAKEKPKLKHFATLHNHIISQTLSDYKNFKKIIQITRINKSLDKQNNYVAIINDILDESTINEVESKYAVPVTEDVISLIENFIKKLKHDRANDLSNNFDAINEEAMAVLGIEHTNDGPQDLLKEPVLSNKIVEIPDHNNKTYDSLEDSRFAQSGRRIYEGDRIKIKYFPYVASIHIFRRFHCAGTIIKMDLIITACSCLQLAWNNRFFRENPKFLSARVGSTFYDLGGEVIPVAEIYFHPSYNPKTLKHNLAVMRLERVIILKWRLKNIRKIPFDKSERPLSMLTPGVVIVGWGARTEKNVIANPMTNRLAFSRLDVYHLEECQDIYSKTYVTKLNFCAGFISKGGGACNRDAGAPGIVDDVLVGVVSFGSPVCGAPDSPTVFTKVGYYADWIEEIESQRVSRHHAHTTMEPPNYFISWPRTTKKKYFFESFPVPEDFKIPFRTRNEKQDDDSKKLRNQKPDKNEEIKDLINEFLKSRNINESVMQSIGLLQKPNNVKTDDGLRVNTNVTVKAAFVKNKQLSSAPVKINVDDLKNISIKTKQVTRALYEFQEPEQSEIEDTKLEDTFTKENEDIMEPEEMSSFSSETDATDMTTSNYQTNMIIKSTTNNYNTLKDDAKIEKEFKGVSDEKANVEKLLEQAHVESSKINTFNDAFQDLLHVETYEVSDSKKNRDDSDGMSIDFKDLSRSRNDTNTYLDADLEDIEEIYRYLSEAMRNNNNTK